MKRNLPEHLWVRHVLGTDIPKKDQKKVRIINATIESIQTEGVGAVSFASVGKKLKMQPAHLVYYFPTKTALLLAAFQAVIVTAQEVTKQEVSKSTSPPEALQAIVKGAYRHIAEYPSHRAVLVALLSETLKEKKCQQLIHEARQTGFDRLKSLVQADSLARAIQCAITGFIVDAISRTLGGDELKESERQALLAIQILSQHYAK